MLGPQRWTMEIQTASVKHKLYDLKDYGKNVKFLVTSHEDSEGRWSVGLPSLFLYTAQIGWQICQFYAQAAPYPQGNSLVFTSVKC